MDTTTLWKKLTHMMAEDAQYQQALKTVQAAEPAYLAVVEKLSAPDRETVERYIAACEALDDPLIYLAYQIGRVSAYCGE